MILPPRLRSRRELRAHDVSTARLRRSASYRDPNVFEIIVGLTVFVVIAAGCLYVVAALGR